MKHTSSYRRMEAYGSNSHSWVSQFFSIALKNRPEVGVAKGIQKKAFILVAYSTSFIPVIFGTTGW